MVAKQEILAILESSLSNFQKDGLWCKGKMATRLIPSGPVHHCAVGEIRVHALGPEDARKIGEGSLDSTKQAMVGERTSESYKQALLEIIKTVSPDSYRYAHKQKIYDAEDVVIRWNDNHDEKTVIKGFADTVDRLRMEIARGEV